MLSFQIRKDRNFTNLVEGREWLQTGQVYRGDQEPLRADMVRLFPGDGSGQSAVLPIWMLETVSSEE